MYFMYGYSAHSYTDVTNKLLGSVYVPILIGYTRGYTLKGADRNHICVFIFLLLFYFF